ncbi:hypothetical protein BRD13_03455 [Halobacteriales archaeon SW_5_70_135]|nr:MAG: hypothetical protein BRD13_03455 [Halobacteriales archaeon SW_5_70_135]
MSEPRVPGRDSGSEATLPCGERVAAAGVDMGMREYDCDCGSAHAVVTDVHPPSRFVPEAMVRDLRAVVETDDEFEQFGTAHLLGMAREEFPGKVVSLNVSEDGTVGYATLWVAAFDARRLHELVVELVVEMMDHALSHADDPAAREQFREQLRTFDVEEFVDRYRRRREFTDEHDDPV